MYSLPLVTMLDQDQGLAKAVYNVSKYKWTPYNGPMIRDLVVDESSCT